MSRDYKYSYRNTSKGYESSVTLVFVAIILAYLVSELCVEQIVNFFGF